MFYFYTINKNLTYKSVVNKFSKNYCNSIFLYSAILDAHFKRNLIIKGAKEN